MSGRQDSHSFGAELSATVFLIQQMLGRVCTATLAQVKAVSNNGGVSPVGTVTIQPLVNQVDGSGNAVPHGPIYNVPYFRLQGGSNAVILDPEIGDIGIAVFADHDISSVQSTKAAANPGSNRRFDMSDALYLGGFLGAAPTQYVQFDAAGIAINSPNAVTVTAPDVTVNASSTATVKAPTVDVNASSAANVTSPMTTVNGDAKVTGNLLVDGSISA